MKKSKNIAKSPLEVITSEAEALPLPLIVPRSPIQCREQAIAL